MGRAAVLALGPPPPVHRAPQPPLETRGWGCPVPAAAAGRAGTPGVGFQPTQPVPGADRPLQQQGWGTAGFEGQSTPHGCWERPGFPQRQAGPDGDPPSPVAADGATPPDAITSNGRLHSPSASSPAPGPLHNPQITESPGTSILLLIPGLKNAQSGFDAVHYKQLSYTALLAVIAD